MLCNKCGKKLKEENNIIKEDYIYIRKDWGYFSKKDGIVWELCLCEECAGQLEEKLVVPIKKTEKTEMI